MKIIRSNMGIIKFVMIVMINDLEPLEYEENIILSTFEEYSYYVNDMIYTVLLYLILWLTEILTFHKQVPLDI